MNKTNIAKIVLGGGLLFALGFKLGNIFRTSNLKKYKNLTDKVDEPVTHTTTVELIDGKIEVETDQLKLMSDKVTTDNKQCCEESSCCNGCMITQMHNSIKNTSVNENVIRIMLGMYDFNNDSL